MSTQLALKRKDDVASTVEVGSRASLVDLPEYLSAESTVAAPLVVPSDATNAESFRLAPATLEAARQVSLTKLEVPKNQLVAEWHGLVLAIHDDRFIAELRGTVGDGVRGSLEEAEIPLEEVRPDDLDLLQVGAFFRLSVSHSIEPRGARRRYTDLTFRRLSAYRNDELLEARERAQELARAIRME